MFEAPLGDDVFREDPTINELQKVAAETLGKEAALFVPSGTMGNEIALRAHTQPGQEVIAEEGSHIYNYESGGPAALSGVTIRPLKGKRGIMAAKDVVFPAPLGPIRPVMEPCSTFREQ